MTRCFDIHFAKTLILLEVLLGFDACMKIMYEWEMGMCALWSFWIQFKYFLMALAIFAQRIYLYLFGSLLLFYWRDNNHWNGAAGIYTSFLLNQPGSHTVVKPYINIIVDYLNGSLANATVKISMLFTFHSHCNC